MHPFCSLMVSMAVLLLSLTAGSLTAQSVDVNVAVNQSFTSVESVPSPTGWRIGVHAPSRFGRLGVQAGIRHVSESGGEISGYCGLFCVDGPFDQSFQLTTVDFGLMYAVVPGAVANLNLGVAGSLSSQRQRLEHLETGDVSSRSSVGPDLGVGVFAEARFPRLVLGFRPMAYARYDRIGASECVADGSCYGGRHVATVGVGIAWGVR